MGEYRTSARAVFDIKYHIVLQYRCLPHSAPAFPGSRGAPAAACARFALPAGLRFWLPALTEDPIVTLPPGALRVVFVLVISRCTPGSRQRPRRAQKRHSLDRNPPCLYGQRGGHCMARGSWDHALQRARGTHDVTAYFRPGQGRRSIPARNSGRFVAILGLAASNALCSPENHCASH